MSWMLPDPRFRPEEIAEILGVDRKTVMKLTDNRLLGYYQLGRRTRRVGLRHLREYISRIQDEAERIGKERQAKLRKVLRHTACTPQKIDTTFHNSAARNCEEECSCAPN
jgi:excisionase family DNA binding protein